LSGPFTLGLTLYSFLLLMNQFLLIAEKTLSKNLGWDLTFQWFLYLIPSVLVMTIPMSVLLGGLIAIGRLSADHEWTAIQSAGIGSRALAKPLFAFGLFWTIVSFILYGYIVPITNYKIRHLTARITVASNLAADIKPGVFYTQLQNTVIFVDNIRPAPDQKLQGVLIQRRIPERNTEEITLARSGDIIPHPDGRLTFDLREGTLHTYNPHDADTYQTSTFKRYQVTIEPPRFLENLKQAPRPTLSDMSPGELLAERNALDFESATDTTRPHIERRSVLTTLEFHRRLALPFACLLFSLLALPLGVTRARSGKGAGFAVSLGIILVYWLLFMLSRDRAESGSLPPAAAAWLANAVIAIWTMLAYYRIRRASGSSRTISSWLIHGFMVAFGRLTAIIGRQTAETDRETTEAGEEQLYSLGGTQSRFLSRIDKYIAHQFLRVTGFALLSCFMIFFLVEIRRLLDGVSNSPGTFLVEVTKYFLYAAPGMLTFVLPIACLVGAIVCFTLFARTGELTALRASGTSLRRAIAPVLLLTIALCGCLFLIQDRISPVANSRAAEIKDRILGRTPMTYGHTPGGQWAFGEAGQKLYHFLLYDDTRDLFQGMRVFSIDRARREISDHWYADRATWRDQGGWELQSGWVRHFPSRDSPSSFERFEISESADFDNPEEFARRNAALSLRDNSMNSQLSINEITEMKKELKAQGYDTTRLTVSYWNKWSQSLTPLVMVLLGLPFAFRVGKGGSLSGIGVALILVLAYWATFALFRALGLETFLPPGLAIWAPNVLFGLFGTYLIFFIRT
jgi:LPS export ABC transporter permease LptF/LPS export ABC transporter permease LptG